MELKYSTSKGSSSNDSNRWMLIAGAASVTIAAAGYLLYGYSTGWKGAAYSFWSPRENLTPRTVKSPFFA